jgi:preprotein translocase subunit YajC
MKVLIFISISLLMCIFYYIANHKNSGKDDKDKDKSNTKTIVFELSLVFLLSFSMLYFIYIMIYNPSCAEKKEMLKFTEKGEPSF